MTMMCLLNKTAKDNLEKWKVSTKKKKFFLIKIFPNKKSLNSSPKRKLLMSMPEDGYSV